MKTADFDARIGVDTSENLRKFRRFFETPQSAMLTAQAEKGTELPIQFKHPASSAVAAVGTAFAVGSSELICNALEFAQSLASFEK